MRHLLQDELPLFEFLLELADVRVDLSSLEVRPMADQGMGSLSIAPFEAGRKLGSSPAECHFYGADGVPVSAVLNLDQQGRLFEVDIWRVDFSPTGRWPLRAELIAGPPNNSFKPNPLRGSA